MSEMKAAINIARFIGGLEAELDEAKRQLESCKRAAARWQELDSEARKERDELKRQLEEVRGDLKAMQEHHARTEEIICDARGQLPETGSAILWTLDDLKQKLAAAQAALAKTRSALVGLDLYATERCGDYLGSPAHTRVSEALAIAVAASTTKRQLEGGAA